MPFEIPERTGVIGALQTYVRAALPSLDPSTTRRSFVGGLVKSFSQAVHDFYQRLKKFADFEVHPQTARGEFLFDGWWSALTGLSRNPATPASGYVVMTGTSGTLIPAGTTLESGGATYEVDTTAAIVAQSVAATSLTYSGGVCIFETASPHFLATGQTLVISGADQAAYNGTFVVAVTADNEFTYSPTTTPSPTTATGSPMAAGTFAIVPLTASETGQATNRDSGSLVNLVDAVSGADAVARATFGGIGGGTEQETEDEFRIRVLEALGSIYGAFNEDEIRDIVKAVPGVTHVWIRKAKQYPAPSGWPIEGQVKVAFLRANDANPIPSGLEVATVKAAIIARAMTANTAEEDVIVIAPTPNSVDFEFDAIDPPTASMRLAVEQALRQFFAEEVEFGQSISEDAYRCAIRDAYDLETRQRLKSFTLAEPSGDISIGVDEIPLLGDIVFN